MNRLISMSKKLDTFFRVLQKIVPIAAAVAFLVTLILTIVNRINPSAVIGEGFNTVDIGPLTIELTQELAPGNAEILGYVWIMLIPCIVCAALICYALGLIRRILAPMTEGRPFDRSVGRNIRKLSFVFLALGAVQNIGSVIDTAAAIRTFSLADLANSGAVRSITANYSLDLTFLITFFVLLLMSHIFSYGAELQQLSDETL